jgi:hypothetical protein
MFLVYFYDKLDNTPYSTVVDVTELAQLIANLDFDRYHISTVDELKNFDRNYLNFCANDNRLERGNK